MVVAVGLAWWATRTGVGYDDDSYHYLTAAHTFLEQGIMLVPGVGKMEVMTHWAPLYPMVIAWLHEAGCGSELMVARGVGLTLFPLNILLMAALARKTGCSWEAVLLLLTGFVFSPIILWVHATAMAEVLCLTFWLGSLWLLLEHERTGAGVWLLGAAVTAGACSITRYAGMALILAEAGFLLTRAQGGQRRKWRDALWYMLIALAPFGCWQYFLYSQGAGGGVGRQFAFQGLTGNQMSDLAAAVTRWLLPFDRHAILRDILAGVTVAGLLAVVWLTNKGRMARAATGQRWHDSATARLLLWNFFIYEGLVFGTGLYLDRGQDFDDRIQFFPFIFVLLLAGATWAGWLRERLSGNRRAKILGAGIVALVLCGHVAASAAWVAHGADFYLGFNSALWRQMQVMTLIQGSYSNRVMYANNPPPLGLITGRHDIYYLPDYELRDQPNPQFYKAMPGVIDDITLRHGLLVIFKNDISELTAIKRNYPQLQVAAQTTEAVIFEAASSGKK